MFDYFDNLKFVPFMLSAGAPAKFSGPRLVEAVLIAAFTAGVTWGVTQRDIAQVKEDIKELRTAVTQALKVQAEIVPMRNLQVQILQEQAKEIQLRVRQLEDRGRK